MPGSAYTVIASNANTADQVIVNTFRGDDAAQISSTTGKGSTHINTGAGPAENGGDNQITVGSASDQGLDLIEGPLFIDAGNGKKNSLTFTEAASLAGDTLTLTNDSLIRNVPLPPGSPPPTVPVREGTEDRYDFTISYKATNGAFGAGIALDATRGTDTVYVASTPRNASMVTINTEAANLAVGDPRDQDLVVFGYDGQNPSDPEGKSTLDQILSPVTVQGGGSSSGSAATEIIVADEGANKAETYMLEAEELSRSNAAPIYFNKNSAVDTQLLDLTLEAGPLGNHITIAGTNAATAAAPNTTLGGTVVDTGKGNDTIDVQDGSGTLNSILGPLFVNGQFGTDSMTVNDTGSGLGQTYQLGLSHDSSGHVTGGTFLRAKSQLLPPVNISFSGISSLKFAASDLTKAPASASNSIAVAGTDAKTEIDTEGGANKVTVTGFNAIQFPLTLKAKAGATNSLTVDDSAATAPGTYTVTNKVIEETATNAINYANYSQVTLLPAQAQKDQVNVQSTAAGTSYTIGADLDSGANAYIVGDTSNTLDQILGTLQFKGLRSTLTLNDQGSLQHEQYGIYSDHVTRGSTSIGFNDLALTLNGGDSPLGNLVTVHGAPAPCLST